MLEGFGVAVAFGVGVAVAFGAAVAVACGLGAAVGADVDSSVRLQPEKHIIVIPNAINTAIIFLLFIFLSSRYTKLLFMFIIYVYYIPFFFRSVKPVIITALFVIISLLFILPFDQGAVNNYKSCSFCSPLFGNSSFTIGPPVIKYL